MKTFVERRFQGKSKLSVCDFAIEDGHLITTVELKKYEDSYWADIFTSARHGELELNLVSRVQTTLGLNKTESEALAESEALYLEFVKPLALKSSHSGGFSQPLNPPEADYRQAQAWFHLCMHAEAGNIPSEGFPVAFRTALEYKLIKSFGFRAATPMIAEFENITPVAADRRLFMAREANYLAKVSGASATKRSQS
jgi:hypothetical protein